MADELKNRSFRISDETTEKFRQLCGDFDNQNVALSALISAYEVQQAKAVLTERQTDVSDYDTHLQALQRAFLHSLELNENAESRIRQEFQRQLDSKDSIISDLQESIRIVEQSEQTAREQAVTITGEADARVQQAETEIDSLKKELEFVNKQSWELSESVKAFRSQIADKQQIIDNLNQKISEVETATKKANEAEARTLKAESELSAVKLELLEAKKKYSAEIKAAEQSAKVAEKIAEADKREALADQKEKYIEELDKLRQEIKALTTENFSLKEKFSSNSN